MHAREHVRTAQNHSSYLLEVNLLQDKTQKISANVRCTWARINTPFHTIPACWDWLNLARNRAAGPLVCVATRTVNNNITKLSQSSPPRHRSSEACLDATRVECCHEFFLCFYLGGWSETDPVCTSASPCILSGSSLGCISRWGQKPQGGAKNLKGVPHLKIKVLDVCSNRWATHEMGGTDFKWGGRAPLAPPLATTLYTARSVLALLVRTAINTVHEIM